MQPFSPNSADAKLDAVDAADKKRREQQRRRMVKWRRVKKDNLASMQRERRHLEKELQRQVTQARLRSDGIPVPSPQSPLLAERYRQGCIELAALAQENVALQEAIQEKVTVEQELLRETTKFLADVHPPTDSTDGWLVQFPNQEPPFHFHPFSKAQFDDSLKDNHRKLEQSYPCVATVGTLFGWKVSYAPLVRREGGSTFMAHAQFTRRLQTSLENAATALVNADANLWPVVVSASSWGLSQTGEAYCHALQSFSAEARVLVCNIPGDVNLRYIALAQYTSEKMPDGTRVDKFSIVLADSKENARNREVEGPREDVRWVLEGGTHVTITEVGDNVVDVVYDHWAGCASEIHGRVLYIDWIKFAVRLEQFVSPTGLLML